MRTLQFVSPSVLLLFELLPEVGFEDLFLSLKICSRFLCCGLCLCEAGLGFLS
jgi:hypothetical protein